MSSSEAETAELFRETSEKAISYLKGLKKRHVAPTEEGLRGMEKLPQSLPDHPTPPQQVLDLLDTYGSPATVASNGGRYFGFVIGSALPAALAANWLAGAWNQNGAKQIMSPIAARLEATSLRWIRELVGLPSEADGAFVSGDTMANFSGLAAARHAVLTRAGWDAEKDGLFGAPTINVVLGEEAHVSVGKALTLLGLGRERIIRVPTDDQGRMAADRLPSSLKGPTILCTQAGNVNTGSFDPFPELVDWARNNGAWVHVDGAFGLWAAASPLLKKLTRGMSGADSWATDGHKWLNVPYDSGVVFVREPSNLVAAMGSPAAAYLNFDSSSDRFDFAPEMSRRARGADAWAALLSLGKSGLIDLVERSCRHAQRFAELLREGGCTILNEVVLNQALVSFGDDRRTRDVVKAIQKEGTCWCGETSWKGRVAMRISVSSGKTTEEDVNRAATAILKIARDM
ncbi:MAG: aminotransferase class V-fold PLP-dependent enzyme [Nitrososphaerales archaeon]|jgi:glutamate/tyrosine decarboxylase-like PLP-dependent enzyme